MIQTTYTLLCDNLLFFFIFDFDNEVNKLSTIYFTLNFYSVENRM